MSEHPRVAHIARAIRAAKWRSCPKCGRQVITGPSHDEVAMDVVCDVEPIPFAAEPDYVKAGVPTFDLIKAVLYYRDVHNRDSAQYPIHTEHQCPETKRGN